MASINYATREISCKIVYYGPGLSGKTTNLQVIHRKIPAPSKSEMVSLATETDRTLFFDFLPLDLGSIKGFATKFQLYTVPGQVYYNATRKLVLRGVDGVVFVADSQRDKMQENLESLKNLQENLKEYGIDLGSVPFVIQYNKRDLPGIASVEELDAQLNWFKVPTFEAQAHQGVGVFTTLKAIGKIVIDTFNAKYSARQSSRRPAPVGDASSMSNAAAARNVPVAPAPFAPPVAPVAPMAPAGAPPLAPRPQAPAAAFAPPPPPPAPRPVPVAPVAPPAPVAAPAPQPFAPPAPVAPVAPPVAPLAPLAPPPMAVPTPEVSPFLSAPTLAPLHASTPDQFLNRPQELVHPTANIAPLPGLTDHFAAPSSRGPIDVPSLPGLEVTPSLNTNASVQSVPGLEAFNSSPTGPISSPGSATSSAKKGRLDGHIDPSDLDAEIARYEQELIEQRAQEEARRQAAMISNAPVNPNDPLASAFLSPDELNRLQGNEGYPTRRMPLGPG